jgi:hypothetical protein
MEKCIRCNKQHNGSFGSGRYCSIVCANSRIFSEESKKKKSESNKGSTPPNKGKKIRWEISTCQECGEDIHHRKSTPKKYHSECWLKSSGGLRKGSGRGKSGWYKGYWCDSSYELAWVIYQLDHNKDFERNKVEYEYEWEGKTRKYLPDFIQNNEVIEIKGYITEQTKAKSKSVNNLKILSKKDLKVEFDYVELKYTKNFIELYDSNPHKVRKNKCKVCEKPSIYDYCSRKCSGLGNNPNLHFIK